MYTILINADNSMITSVRERIMQRSKLVDSLHFLVDQRYKELNMNDFTVIMEYVLPVSKKYRTEVLTLSSELYKGKLEYKLPFDTSLTSEAGDIELSLTFTKVELSPEGKNIQYVRKTDTCRITIIPVSAWSDIIPDEALNAIDMAFLKLEGKMKQLEDTANIYHNTKADNIKLDNDSKELYLTANGTHIGNKIAINDIGNSIAENTDGGIVNVII